jgi:hypothetical protein
MRDRGRLWGLEVLLLLRRRHLLVLLLHLLVHLREPLPLDVRRGLLDLLLNVRWELLEHHQHLLVLVLLLLL